MSKLVRIHRKHNKDRDEPYTVLRAHWWVGELTILLCEYWFKRFEKGNQTRGRGLCFRSGTQKHGSGSVARLLKHFIFCLIRMYVRLGADGGGGRRARVGVQAQQQGMIFQ